MTRKVKYETYIRATSRLKQQLAVAELELERAQNRNRNLRTAIKGLERAVNKLKAGLLTRMLAKLALDNIQIVDIPDYRKVS